MKRLSDFPTTESRVIVTLLVFVATAVGYIAGWVVPSTEWLGFLAIMSGLDAAQFYGKRKTYKEPVTNTTPTYTRERVKK